MLCKTHKKAVIAQLVERVAVNLEVFGSNPNNSVFLLLQV